jgi:hypothetical protein
MPKHASLFAARFAFRSFAFILCICGNVGSYLTKMSSFGGATAVVISETSSVAFKLPQYRFFFFFALFIQSATKDTWHLKLTFFLYCRGSFPPSCTPCITIVLIYFVYTRNLPPIRFWRVLTGATFRPNPNFPRISVLPRAVFFFSRN